MKTTRLFFIPVILTGIMFFSSCGSDEEKPQTAPTVTTSATIPTTQTTATVSGEITDTGNATITEAGFVYSSNVDEPTTSDNKVQVTDLEDFTKELTGLASGTEYHVRAYAINKKGTAYGENRLFETGNAAPLATNVQITGTLEVNKDVTATYTYTDAENNAQGTSVYQWYVADDAAGTNEILIEAETDATLHVLDAHNGKFLKVVITPVAQTGTTTGLPVSSGYSTAVGAETVTFTYAGSSVTYGTLVSPVTQKKWMDRNLGASRVAQTLNDWQAYGDMFQWGRKADGHQRVTRTGPNDGDITGVTGITSTVAPFDLSPADVPATDKFIINNDNATTGDWRETQNDNLWQGVAGVNNPCPAGWRVPTQAEFAAEAFTNGTEAFNRLKMTLSGQRDRTNGTFRITEAGVYWTSTIRVSATTPGRSRQFTIDATTANIANNNYTDRANGQLVRCIKE